MKKTEGSILQVENICKSYAEFALKDVSFSLMEGSIMGLIGMNGAGKSTTMKSILNLLKPDSGEVYIFGEKVRADDCKTREEIGVVFDESCFPQLVKISELENILKNIFARWNSNLFHSLTKRFSLPEKTRIKDFSRGMKMKLAIAVAMSHGARLLILDEPTSGLDPIVRNEILDLFLEFIQNSHNSILVSSHITGDLEKIADYITFIDQGKIVMSGCKDDIIYGHAVAKATRDQILAMDKSFIVATRDNRYDSEALVRQPELFKKKHPNIATDTANLEDIMMFLVHREAALGGEMRLS